MTRHELRSYSANFEAVNLCVAATWHLGNVISKVHQNITVRAVNGYNRSFINQ